MKKDSFVRIHTVALLIGLSFNMQLHADETGPEIKIENAYIPQLPSSVSTRAAYFNITNLGPQKRTITAVTAEGFKMAKLHQTMVKDGISSMESVPSVEIPAGETLALEPGGYHVMLMSQEEESASIGEVPITLTFANGENVNFVALVQSNN